MSAHTDLVTRLRLWADGFGGETLCGRDCRDAAERIEELERWRDDVTVALRNPGGAFFADVPTLIAALVVRAEQAEARVQALEAERVQHFALEESILIQLKAKHTEEGWSTALVRVGARPLVLSLDSAWQSSRTRAVLKGGA